MFEEKLRKNPTGAADLEAFANEEREVDPEGDEWTTSMLRMQMNGYGQRVRRGDLQVHEGGRGISPFPRYVHQLTLLPSNQPYPALCTWAVRRAHMEHAWDPNS